MNKFKNKKNTVRQCIRTLFDQGFEKSLDWQVKKRNKLAILPNQNIHYD